MTTPVAPTIRLVASGRILSSQSWSVGISMNAGPGPYVDAQLQALVNEFSTRFQTLWGTGSTGTLSKINAAGVDLRSFRAYVYPQRGVPAILAAGVDITPVPGNGGFSQPPQCALVASLRTALPGRGNRGRMYLPCTNVTLGTNGQMTLATVQPIAAGVATLLTAMNTFTTGAGYGNVVIAGSAGNPIVNAVQVDSEIDTQRRRTDKLVAASTAVSAVTSD